MLGLVTIGQAPRDDVVRSMFGARVPDGLVQAGALDDLTQVEIARLEPEAIDEVLVSRLVDGTEVTLGKRGLLPLLDAAIQRCEAGGAQLVCILCTGAFPQLRARARLVFPDALLRATIHALQPSGVLGVLMPHEGQRAAMLDKWTTETRQVVAEVASPYTAGTACGPAGRALAEAGAELIVMDCMGFDRAMQASTREACGIPVLLSNGLVGAVLRECADFGSETIEDAVGVEALDGGRS